MMTRIGYYAEMVSAIRPIETLPKVMNYIKYKFKTPAVITECKSCSPQIAHVMMTNRCNLKCGYCNSSKFVEYGEKNTEEVTLDKIKYAFNTLAN